MASAEQIGMEHLIMRYTATARLSPYAPDLQRPLATIHICPTECRRRMCPRYTGCKRALNVHLMKGGALVESTKCCGTIATSFFHVDDPSLVRDISRMMRQIAAASSVNLELNPAPLGDTVSLPIHHASHSYTSLAYISLRDQRRWFPEGISEGPEEIQGRRPRGMGDASWTPVRGPHDRADRATAYHSADH